MPILFFAGDFVNLAFKKPPEEEEVQKLFSTEYKDSKKEKLNLALLTTLNLLSFTIYFFYRNIIVQPFYFLVIKNLCSFENNKHNLKLELVIVFMTNLAVTLLVLPFYKEHGYLGNLWMIFLCWGLSLLHLKFKFSKFVRKVCYFYCYLSCFFLTGKSTYIYVLLFVILLVFVEEVGHYKTYAIKLAQFYNFM